MIDQLRNIFLFLRNIVLIYKNHTGYRRRIKFQLSKDYIKLFLLDVLPGSLKSKIHHFIFLGNKLYFPDLHTTVKLIESIFIGSEYYFEAKNTSPKIIDLGSNIGLSIIYFKSINPDSHIDAFEADPSTFEILSKNVQSYDLSNVIVYNQAVTDSAGFTNFYINQQSVGSTLMSTNPLRIKDSRKIIVSSIQLSSHIKSSTDLLKIDIEGSEYQVLNDISKTGRIKFIKEFCIEYHHHIDTNKDNFSKFLKILEINNFGYQIHAEQKPPFELSSFEDITIHAYQKK